MAFKADDGREFTNRPAARAHSARVAAKKPKSTPVMSNPHGTPAESDSGHDVQHNIQCPHCGGDINADEVLAGRDSAHRGSPSANLDVPSSEF